MLKKYIILIFILILVSNLLADDDWEIVNDSTNFSKFNIHAGVGVLNGTRLGFNYRFNRKISINMDFGFSTHLLLGVLGGPIIVYNTDLNYNFKNMSSPIMNISLAYGKWNKPKNYSLVLSPNIGYVFYNPTNSIYSLQLRIGCGILFNIDNQGPFYNNSTYLLPNFDIILGIQL